MSREFTLMQRPGFLERGRSEVAYANAHTALEAARCDDFLLQQIESRVDELLESRQRMERAKRTLAQARAAVMQAAWSDGKLADKVDLGKAARSLFTGPA